MYSNVDYSRGKIVLALFFILSILSFDVFASAAEDLTIYDQAMRKRNGIGVENVKATSSGITADIKTPVTVNGSKTTVTQKVHIPSNDPFYKSAPKYAADLMKNHIKNGAKMGAFGVAMDAILDSVGWVIDEGGRINKIPGSISDPNNPTTQPYIYTSTGRSVYASSYYQAVNLYFDTYIFDDYYNATASYSFDSRGCDNSGCWEAYRGTITNKSGTQNTSSYIRLYQSNNPTYTPPSTEPVPVTDADLESVWDDWFRNNSPSVTDPVTTYIYSGKPSGNEFGPPRQDGNPTFGSNEITDEMMRNWLDHRDAALDAAARHAADPANNPSPENKPDIETGTKTETDSKNQPKTETEVLPDGTRIVTNTEVHIDPETGAEIVTETKTTFKPDGSSETSTKTTTRPKPETTTTDLPPACDYLAFLCDFVEWFKKDDVHDDSVEITEITPDIGNLDTSTFSASAGCPAPETFSINGETIEISYEPICQFATNWSFVAPLIASFSAALIVIGVGRKGEDSDT